MQPLDVHRYRHVVLFTGAGMSAESGIPTYRGGGGIWAQYRWDEYACQRAFDEAPERVLDFHEERRRAVLACEPHAGHRAVADLQRVHADATIITQNIDGMHQRAGSTGVIELHGSLWRMRCEVHGVREDTGEYFAARLCPQCGAWLRPDVVWFEDVLDQGVLEAATRAVEVCDLFVSVGTSGTVWPAAGFQDLARRVGARCVEVNPEPTEMSALYDEMVRAPASEALPVLLGTG